MTVHEHLESRAGESLTYRITKASIDAPIQILAESLLSALP
jgi:hypothetical protein